jgi:hypothetical protein
MATTETTAVLDKFIEVIGDKFDKVTFDEVKGFGGSNFADWLIREGYKTRRAWRKSNRKATDRKGTSVKHAGAFVDLKAKAKSKGDKALLAIIAEVEKSHGLSI